MRVAVIGAGVVGVTTAYFLALNGHEVSVIEQRGNVGEEASLGHVGLLGSAHLMPLAAPALPRQFFSHFLKSHHAINLRPRANLTLWRWLRNWLHESSVERLIINQEKMQRLGKYSQELLADITLTHQLDFQQRSGVLQLFRHVREQKRVTAGLGVLSEVGTPFQHLDDAACHQLEPALNKHIPLVGGVYLPQDSNGNCVLFTKQLKSIAQQAGVAFEFLTHCEHIDPSENGVTLHLQKSTEPAIKRQFDAVVLAAGAHSVPFLKNIGIDVRVAQFQSYSTTANIKNPEHCPRFCVIDETEQIAITRMDKRIRVAGTFYLGKNKTKMNYRAWHSLRKTGGEWFPDAANYHTGQMWRGNHLMLPDGIPLLGRTPAKKVFVNLAHAEHGWSMATGSGKILADLISGKTPDIDLTGLSISRAY